MRPYRRFHFVQEVWLTSVATLCHVMRYTNSHYTSSPADAEGSAPALPRFQGLPNSLNRNCHSLDANPKE